MLHVATVDSLLSAARTTLDIPPSCYIQNPSVKPSRFLSPAGNLTAPNRRLRLNSPKIAACLTLLRSTIFTLWARSLPRPPALPVASSTSPTCVFWPPRSATRRPPFPPFSSPEPTERDLLPPRYREPLR